MSAGIAGKGPSEAAAPEASVPRLVSSADAAAEVQHAATELQQDPQWRREGQEWIGQRVRRTIWGMKGNKPVYPAR